MRSITDTAILSLVILLPAAVSQTNCKLRPDRVAVWMITASEVTGWPLTGSKFAAG